MIGHVEQLASLLRKNGVRVSTAEVIDASRAVDCIGVADPGRLRAALAAALVKRASDRPTFDELFDLYFTSMGTSADGETSALARMVGEAGASEEVVRELAMAVAQMSAVARVGLGVGAPEIPGLVRAAGIDVDLERIVTPLQVGFFSYRVMDALDVSDAEAQLRQLLDRLVDQGALDETAAGLLRERIAQNLSGLRRAIRQYVEAEFRKRNLDFMQDLAVRSLSEKPLGQLSDAEVDSLRAEVSRLARVMRARFSLRRKLRKRGRLDLQRTLRGSLATGGVPFVLHRRERERRKPRLVILCDVSDSVRNVSRFMLQFAYLLQEVFDRVDSFAFVSEIGELTDLFRRHDLDRAVDMTLSGAALNVFTNSNYGRALIQFGERHIDKVTPRTTVMIIGDGRNNYHEPRADVLADIQLRAKQVIWLNPESPAAWGFGDSAMRDYEPYCDQVAVAHNLHSLSQVVDQLIA